MNNPSMLRNMLAHNSIQTHENAAYAILYTG